MKRLQLFAILAILLPTAAAFANNDKDDSKITVIKEIAIKADFNAIKTYGGVTLKYTVVPEGQKPSARLKVRKSLDDSVRITVDDNTLSFGIEGKNKFSNGVTINSFSDLFSLIKGCFSKMESNSNSAILYLSAPAVKTIKASSASNVYVNDNYTTAANLTLKSSSAAKIKMHSVSCQKLDVGTSSGSEIEIDNLTADRIYADASSGSDIEIENIDAKGYVTASASSGADINLEGKASTANLSASSGANVDARDLVVDTAELSASSGANVKVTAINGVQKSVSSGGSAKRYHARSNN